MRDGWIEVTELQYKTNYLLNINSISWIHIDSNTVLVNGVDGGKDGLLTLSDDSIKLLIETIRGV